jgi:hypothetical protein
MCDPNVNLALSFLITENQEFDVFVFWFSFTMFPWAMASSG